MISTMHLNEYSCLAQEERQNWCTSLRSPDSEGTQYRTSMGQRDAPLHSIIVTIFHFYYPYPSLQCTFSRSLIP